MWLYRKHYRTVRPTIVYQLITLPYQNDLEGFRFRIFLPSRKILWKLFFSASPYVVHIPICYKLRLETM